ncbi:MAG: hypothetical protein ABIO70_14900 [Pseudomonadota bacterium]
MLLTLLALLAAAHAAGLPAWAVEEVLATRARIGAPPLIATAGPEATTLAADAGAALAQEVMVLRDADPLAALDALVAADPPACGFLLAWRDDGSLTLRRRGACSAQAAPAPVPAAFLATPPVPPPQLPVTPMRLSPWDGSFTVLQEAGPLDVERFSWRVGDWETYRAFRRANNWIKAESIVGVATAAHLAVLGQAINGDHHGVGPDRTLAFFVIEGLAATVGLGAAINFGVRHPRVYRLDTWYDRTEVERWAAAYNAAVEGTVAPAPLPRPASAR